VTVDQAAREKLTLEEETTGTVRAVRRAQVEARVSGILLGLPVVPSAVVEAGELQAWLDDREIQARLDQARAQWEQAKRNFARAEWSATI
jgi:multidrug resistance efflux pump